MLEIADPVFGQMRYDHRWIKKESIYSIVFQCTIKYSYYILYFYVNVREIHIFLQTSLTPT